MLMKLVFCDCSAILLKRKHALKDLTPMKPHSNSNAGPAIDAQIVDATARQPSCHHQRQHLE